MPDMDTEQVAELTDTPILAALSKDLKQAARLLTPSEARFLVDFYYQAQDERIRAAGQIRSSEDVEPNAVLALLVDATKTLEKRIKSALDIYSGSSEIGLWMKEVYGIGPVIAAGLLAHISIERATSAGHIWRLAGLDPSLSWQKGQKRPWNADLKRLTFIIGESFVKFHNREECVYGRIYSERKAREIDRNERGLFADQAALALAKKSYRDDTLAKGHYQAGKLPPAQIHARARRYAVKMFLSHLFECWHYSHYKSLGPMPYSIAHMEHIDYITPPHLGLIKGMTEAIEERARTRS